MLFLLYGYYDIIFLRPQSMHQWRQADCLQIAHNYLTNNWNFFQPSIHNYFSDSETSGKSAGEFPILYYFVAILWKIFGEHEFIYRIVVLAIFYVGLYFLYRLLKNILHSNFWALNITFLLFTSPIITFYANNFLTNIPALSFVFIGWYYFYKYYTYRKNKWLIIATLFFTLAGLLKMTAYISFVTIGSFFLIDCFKALKKTNSNQIFKDLKSAFLILLLGFFALVSWYLYSAYYNNLHGGKYTFNGLMPIWEMTVNKWSLIKTFVNNILIHQFFSSILLWVVLAMGLFILLNYKKVNKFIYTTLVLLIVGVFCFILFWIQAMDAHDYYIINLTILPLFILVGFFWHLHQKYPTILNKISIKIIFSLFVVYNVLYAANNIKMRYWKVFNYNSGIKNIFCAKPEIDYWWWIGNHNLFEPLNDIEHYNRSLGIKKTDLVAFIPDESFAVSLYLMNQKGWTTGFGIENNSNPSQKLNYLIQNKHLKYLFLRDSTALKKQYLVPFLKNPIGNYKGVLIYSLTK